MGHHFLPSEPTKWNVEDVYEFIRSLPGKALGAPHLPGIARMRVRDLSSLSCTRKDEVVQLTPQVQEARGRD
jgi:hypothetical protein